MITFTQYLVGRSDETDKTYVDSLDWDNVFQSEQQAEKFIKRNLKNWGHAEGYTRKDFDIAEVTYTIKRK